MGMKRSRRRIRVPVQTLPAEVDVALRHQVQEIAASLGGIPVDAKALWESLEMGGLLLDVKGWRFSYRVDRKGNLLIVDQAMLKSE